MTWLDIVVLAIAIYSLFAGFKSGIVSQITQILALLLGLFFMGDLALLISPYIQNNTTIPPFWIIIIAYIVAFILIVLVVSIVGWVINLIFKLPILSWLNKIGGMFFSLLKYLLICALLIFFFIKVDTNRSILSPQLINRSKIATTLLYIPTMVIKSIISNYQLPFEIESKNQENIT